MKQAIVFHYFLTLATGLRRVRVDVGQDPGPIFDEIEDRNDADVAVDENTEMLFHSLYRLSQKEEGYPVNIPFIPFLLMWPRSWVEQAKEMNIQKKRKYNFIGHSWSTTFRAEHRDWMQQFVKDRFTANDFYADTGGRNTTMGPSDHSKEWRATTYNENYIHDEDMKFDAAYMKVMAESEFTLCPAGDQPWTYRFLEAIWAKSIPIVEKDDHASSEKRSYGTEAKYSRQIGFHYYIYNPDPNFEYVYNQTWVDENFKKALQHHTLMKEYGESVDSRGTSR